MNQVYIVLLRAINVSGKNIIPMKELRILLSDLGFDNVQTYIQSGNVIISSSNKKETIQLRIKEGIQKKFGLNICVLVRTIPEWELTLKNNPYQTEDTKKQYFTFLEKVPENSHIDFQSPNDEYTIVKDVVYLYCREGRGNTKLTNELFERKLKVAATSRNYRTTYKLLELAR